MSEQQQDISKRIGRRDQENGGLIYPERDGLGHTVPDNKAHLTVVFPLPDGSAFYVLPVGVSSTRDHDAIVAAMKEESKTLTPLSRRGQPPAARPEAPQAAGTPSET